MNDFHPGSQRLNIKVVSYLSQKQKGIDSQQLIPSSESTS